MLQKPFSAHSTELRRDLHWLPIRQRIEYKIAAITHKTKHSGLPVYLHDLLHDYQPTRTLRSSTANKLQRPPLISSFADRSFRLQHRPFGYLYRHHYDQLDPLTLLVFLNLDLKPICSRQHISPRTVQRHRSAPDSLATRALWKIVLTLTSTLVSCCGICMSTFR